MGGNATFCHVSRNQIQFLSTLSAAFAFDREAHRQVTLGQRKLLCQAEKKGCSRAKNTYMGVGEGAIIVLGQGGILVCCPRRTGGQAEEK